MSEQPQKTEDLRRHILASPETILEDDEVMRVLIAANERAIGPNVVDLRGVAMARLETRLAQLEDTHRGVIAAAYDNVAGTNQIHRAVLRMLDAATFEEFIHNLTGDVAAILRIASIRLVLETHQAGAPLRDTLGETLVTVPAGFIADYIALGRAPLGRPVTLRQIQPPAAMIHGENAGRVLSEACLLLDLGPGRLPGMLALGSEDGNQFKPNQGTDFLAFFAGVFERSMRRWLA
ncbi:MAG: DUF484 family protein [Paracoccaceae bacterium]